MKFAIVAIVCLFASGCATADTMVSATASFNEQVRQGKVKDIAGYSKLNCRSEETAIAGSGLKCVILHVWPNESDKEFDYVLLQMPGEKQWRMVSVDDLDKKPLTTIHLTQ